VTEVTVKLALQHRVHKKRYSCTLFHWCAWSW